MLVRIYWITWAIFAGIGALLFAAGAFTMWAAVIMGFAAFGLTFMGMMNVLPGMVTHPAPKSLAPEPKPVAAPVQRTAPAKAFNVLKSA